MLDKTIPANVIPFIYPLTCQIVRVHRHTEDSSVWIVAVDVCRILNLANTSYVTSKLNQNKVYKHLCITDGGKQTVTWIELSEVIELAHQNGNDTFAKWLVEMKRTVPLPDDISTNHQFKDPVIIERETINKFRELYLELKSQNLI